MRAIVFEQPGEPAVMKVSEVPAPKPGAGELLLRVRAAGVNRADLYQRMGRYPPPPGESEILGLEVAGEVVEVGRPEAGNAGRAGEAGDAGAGARREWKVGERAMALLSGGGYAELARVPAAQALPIPETLSFVEAAGVPEAYLTAWLNLFVLGGLQPGEVCVVHAAASGVGTAALQLCRGVASAVIATASKGKLGALKAYGATHLLARDEVPAGLADAVTSAAGRGADLILDLVGASYLGANIAALALHGRLICIATQGGAKGELDLGAMLHRRLTLIGSTLRSRTPAQKAALCRDFAQRALPRFESGQLRPVIARTFPLAQAAAAHALLATNEVIGKLVLEV